MNTNLEIIESRKKAAALIKGCLYQGILTREALKLWPLHYNDPTLICAKHALIHYEADGGRGVSGPSGHFGLVSQ